MEREQELLKAKRTIRKFLSKKRTRGSRIHQQAIGDSVNRLRALNGLCGECSNLKLRPQKRGGRQVVAVLCEKDHSPFILYQNTPLGEQATCKDYHPLQSPKGEKLTP